MKLFKRPPRVADVAADRWTGGWIGPSTTGRADCSHEVYSSVVSDDDPRVLSVQCKDCRRVWFERRR